MRLLSALQTAHDYSSLENWVDNFNQRARGIAEREVLQYAE